MITIILLSLIYFAFISLGLPDSLLGVSWPVMQLEWGMPIDAVGLVSLFITGSTVISSILSGRIIKIMGTGKVTFISCLMTGVALLGMSYAPSYIWLIFLAIPLGFGGGSVDAALNNYVALHFKAHHMNWLHSFWGVGATLGPLIMSQALLHGSWRNGYRTISLIQLSLATLLLISLAIWTKHQKISKASLEDSSKKTHTNDKERNIFHIKGVKFALATFLFYCAIEASVGLWGSSFLVEIKGLSVETASSWIAMYFGGITIGRFISGFISFKLSNTQMIRMGVSITLVGIILLLIPLPSFVAFIAFMIIGLGLAPIFPAMIHETPERFGEERSQDIIGYQMASAYTGSALLPPLFGVLVKNTSISLFPIYLLVCIIVIIICTEILAGFFKKSIVK